MSVPLRNNGKKALVLDRVRILGATPGMHLVGTYIAWLTSRGVATGPGDLPASERNSRPEASRTVVPPGKGFMPELSLTFAGTPHKWTYSRLEIAYHVGNAHYRQTYPVGNTHIVC